MAIDVRSALKRLALTPRADAPADPMPGELWSNDATGRLLAWRSGQWRQLAESGNISANDVVDGVLALARLPVAPSGNANPTQVVRADDARLANNVPTSRTISAGVGLTGGGDLSANRTIAVDLAAIGVAAGQIVLGANVIQQPEGANAYRIPGAVLLTYYLKVTAATPAGTTLLTLPAGWRPPRIVRTIGSAGVSTHVSTTMNTAGVMWCEVALGINEILFGTMKLPI